MFWLGYYNSVQLNSKWNINTDIQHRTKNGYEIQSQSLIRSSLAYKFNEGIQISGGVAHFRHFLTNELNRGEWRPWQEISAAQQYDKFRLSNKIRIEQRYNQIVVADALTNYYSFNWRFRYKFDLDVVILKRLSKTHTLNIGNEFMLNAGRSVLNPFDQNRSYVSINYQIATNLKIQFQYMYIVQYLPSKINYDHISVLRFNLYHTINNERSSGK
jgi:hypothetical protein